MAQLDFETHTASHNAPSSASPSVSPGPLGLSAFALTTFILCCIHAGFIVPSVDAGTSIVIAPAIFYGGLVQLLAGMWAFKVGNTFAGTAFSSYGGFWLAVGLLLLPGSGLVNALAQTPGVIHPALGLFLLGWTIFTGLMFLGTLRMDVAHVLIFAALFLTFLALTIAELRGGDVYFTQIGGYLGIATAILAWYTAIAGILSSSKSVFRLPIGPLP